MLTSFLENLGHRVLKSLNQAGDFAVLSGRTFAAVFKRPFDTPNLLHQFSAVGVNSIPVVVLTSLAISMVFAVQLSYGFRQFQAEGLASQVQGLAIVRELAPVITGLMMAGRVGLGHGRGAGHHAGHRTDRRPGVPGHGPHPLSLRAAPAGLHGDAPPPHRALHLRRLLGRLHPPGRAW